MINLVHVQLNEISLSLNTANKPMEPKVHRWFQIAAKQSILIIIMLSLCCNSDTKLPFCSSFAAPKLRNLWQIIESSEFYLKFWQIFQYLCQNFRFERMRISRSLCILSGSAT